MDKQERMNKAYKENVDYIDEMLTEYVNNNELSIKEKETAMKHVIMQLKKRYNIKENDGPVSHVDSL